MQFIETMPVYARHGINGSPSIQVLVHEHRHDQVVMMNSDTANLYVCSVATDPERWPDLKLSIVV